MSSDPTDQQRQESSIRKWTERLPFTRKPFDPRDYVTPEAFSVEPQLLGTPLARPHKRLLAWAVDALAVAILSQASGILLALALALLFDRILRQTQFLVGDQWRQRLRILLVTVFVAWAGFQMVSYWKHRDSTVPVQNAKTAAKLAVEAVDEGKITDLQDAADKTVLKKAADKTDLKDAADKDDDAKDDSDKDSARVEELKKEVDELKSNQGFSVIDWLKNLLGDIGFDFGWAAIYWTLITAWWNGQTLGKRLFGLRVLQLNGEPLTTWDSFNRCGGYAAGVATGLLGFAQVYWDPNRQAIHDKVSFTVVADERRQKMAWPLQGQQAPPPAA